MAKDHPWSALAEEVEATLFRVHPYRRPVVGYIRDLAGTSAADMERYYETFYRPDNAALVVVGDLDPAATIRSIRGAFAGVARPRTAVPRPPLFPEPPPQGERRVVLEKETSVRRLIVSAPAPPWGHADEAPARVAAALLADGRRSRLYRALVEDKRLASDLGEELSPRLDPGPLFLFFEAAAEASREKLEAAVFDEVDRLARRGPTAAELRRAKARLVTRHLLQRETMQGEAEAIGESFVYGDADVPELSTRIAAVEAADVMRVVASMFAPHRRVVAWLVPPAGGRRIERSASRAEEEAPSAEAPVPEKAKRRSKSAVAHSAATSVVRAARVELPVERVVLPNGIVVLAHTNPGSATATLDVEVAAGSRDESDRTAGLARLTAMLLTQGTTRRSAEEIADAVESRGGNLEVEALFDRTHARLECLGENLLAGLALVSEILSASRFPRDRVALQKELLAEEIRSEHDNPPVVASRALAEIIYKGHPLHRPVVGYEKSVAKLGRPEIVRFARARYAPDGTRVAISSGLPAREVIDLVAGAFGKWKGRAEPRAEVAALSVGRPAAPRRIAASKEQCHILVGHLGIRRSDPGFVAAQVLDMVLGAGPGFVSRIPKVLRDSMGLAYTTWADVTQSAGLEPGRFAAYIATAPENEKRALGALRREIEQFVEKGPTDQEVAEAKAHLTGRYVFDVESNSQRCETMLGLERHGLGLDYLSRYAAEVLAVTAEDVRRVAKRVVIPGRLATVIVGGRAR